MKTEDYDPALNDPALHAIRRGWDCVRSASHIEKICLALLLLLAITFLPFGRTSPGAHIGNEPGNAMANQPARLGGGIWKPLAVDSGYLFKDRIATDYFCVYEAGSLVLHGRDPFLVNLISADPLKHPPTRAPWVATYRYLPLTAVLLGVPLNVLPPWSAYVAWIALNFVLLIANFLLCVGRRPKALLVLGVIWLAWFPLSVEWYMGQFSLLMASLMLWSLDALSRGVKLGAWLWAASVALKVYTCAMALPLWLWHWRRTVILTAVILGSTTIGYFALNPQSRDYFQSRGLEGRVLMHEQQPYAGAQGMQAGVNATIWVLQGRSFNQPLAPEDAPTSPLRDPVTWAVGAMLGIFGLAVLWSLKDYRKGFSPVAMGMFWLIWFYAYRDTWEHHMVLLQALVAFWLIFGVLKPWQAIVTWVGAGTPSLWLPFLWAQANNIEPAQTLLGLLYFWQRPAAILFVTVAGLLHMKKRMKAIE
ncbi:DUF2029 domain-containing protein [bacterium]|nr:DUF2029 domain-containing protein [bacterium]